MNIDTAYTDKFKKPTARGPRDELILKFLDRINPAREKATFKPYSYQALAARLKRLKEPELFALYKQCTEARSFTALFEWTLKNSKV
jgi:hypothetical protein